VRRNGETNPVTVIVVLALAAAGFYIYHVGPLYMDNLDAKEAAAEAFNVFFTDGEEAAKTRLLIRLNAKSPGTHHYEVDDEGVESIVPGFGLGEDNVTFAYDEKAKSLKVRIEYDRLVEFSPLKKRKLFHLIAEKSGTQIK
jgi:hypothetical protein